MQGYRSLQETHEADEEVGTHVQFTVTDSSHARWNHIEDLDTFFSRVYSYHQRHGFFCMVLRDVLEQMQFVYIVFISVYLIHGIEYAILFKITPPKSGSNKVTPGDVILPLNQCIANFTAATWMILTMATTAWLLRVIKMVYQFFCFWDTKQFYNTALKIADRDLGNMTWHDVVVKVKAVQIEQQMCIHKRELSELDIYHRILRQHNYFVAMVNKKLLPPRLEVPFLGEFYYWTAGLKFNIQLLFFWSPWSPFEHPWQLREEYKKANLRHELAGQLAKHVLWLAIANFVFSIPIFIYQCIHTFFSYFAILRKEPSILAKRRWSQYGRLYLRHFNELDHELNTRLTRAYKPASKYLASFSSPITAIVCENLGFYSASIFAILGALAIYDEDVLSVEYVLAIFTLVTVIFTAVEKVVPDEMVALDLEELLTKVVEHTHYLPQDWKGQAHTDRIRKEFEHLFPYTFVSLIEDLLSPLITPYVLLRHIYPRSIEFVDFFRNFTVSVVGVGDVCSFAQMDVRKHGNPDWQKEPLTVPDQYSQGEDGKVEISLVHFKATNPSWEPPEHIQDYVAKVQRESSILGLSSVERLRDPNYEEIETDWRVGEPVASDAIHTSADSGLRKKIAASTGWQSQHEPTSKMWMNEGASLASIREMAQSAAYLHHIYTSKTAHVVRNTAQETTPLLPGSNR